MGCNTCFEGSRKMEFERKQAEVKSVMRDAMLREGIQQKRLGIVLGVNDSTSVRLLDEDDISVPVKVASLMLLGTDDETRTIAVAVWNHVGKSLGLESEPMVSRPELNGTIDDEKDSIMVCIGKITELHRSAKMDKHEAEKYFDEIIRQAKLGKAELGI